MDTLNPSEFGHAGGLRWDWFNDLYTRNRREYLSRDYQHAIGNHDSFASRGWFTLTGEQRANCREEYDMAAYGQSIHGQSMRGDLRGLYANEPDEDTHVSTPEERVGELTAWKRTAYNIADWL